MFLFLFERLRRLRPAGPTSFTRQVPAAAGALLTLLLTGLSSRAVLGPTALHALPYLIAPMAASAVLLFCLPAAPLAQPWPVIGGNVVSALVGVACSQGLDPLLGAPLAGGLAIAAMASLRCLHPPGGAVAVTAVLGGAAVHDVGYWFVLAPVGLNSVLMVLGAVAWNKLSGHAYPHVQPAVQPPEQKAGFAREDLDAALDSYGETLDVSRDDLATIFAETEQRAAERRARLHHCGELAKPVPATLRPEMPLAAARALLVQHGVPALPVVDEAGRPVGVLSMSGLVAAGGSASRPLPARARRATALLFGHDTVPTVGQLVEPDFMAVKAAAPVTALLARFHEGAREVLVVDEEGRLTGMVQPGDLLVGLDLGLQESAA
ncbi:HPP family protein [Massilia sp. IC2-477]|uniref:HPP family protein n=1 Tax=unclassified Massilia TaxID=2609279 RepID=UPI001D12135F|nr:MULTISPECIES: HPP family protein [unclassified Massilia]MCC2956492.1 HPP family protein [Massilia sp. IC2-477]MCC2972143.1 HPP family protein [Massilia sp. IC2-476]